MNRRLYARVLTVFCVAVLSILLIDLRGIRRGLDLQGGIQLVAGVVVDDAVRAVTDNTIQSLRQEFQNEHVIVDRVSRDKADGIQVEIHDAGNQARVRRILEERFRDWSVTPQSGSNPNALLARLNPTRADAIRDSAVDQTMRVIRNRIDQPGVGEISIQRQGRPSDHQILIELPGVDDFERVKRIIQAAAVLEMKLVEAGPFPTLDVARGQYAGRIPEDVDLLPDTGGRYYALQRMASISGSQLKDAYASKDENGRPAVGFALTADGAQRFGRLTEENIGKDLAVVLDGRIRSVAVIESRISDAGTIRGGGSGFAPQEVSDLVLTLKSGALPASVQYLEEQFIGPSLGADSIRKGFAAAVAALVCVIAFMLVYYRWSGLNAVLAMILNITILLGSMAYFGAVLTLPGIAGVILTIGVGIDSNVLIFERIREEIREGRPVAASVSTGFRRVFVTLVDTHLAALISAAFLFVFGTGPIKGFAVTLVIGLASNMFTSVFVSRTMFDWWITRRRREALSI